MWLYAFAAKEIQKYILQGDKLKDMVGGSELVEKLCKDFFKDTLKSLGINKSRFSPVTQAAGWARIIFDDKLDAEKVHAIWPFLVDRFAPGLQILQSLIEVKVSLPEAIRESEEILRVQRNIINVALPEITPLIDRNPRTGNAGVKYEKNSDPHILDLETLRKREFLKSNSLTEKMTDNKDNSIVWPSDMNAIAGNESNYIAVIHADGNNLGQTLIKLASHLEKQPGDASEVFRGFSSAIEDATLAAAQRSFKLVLLPDYNKSRKGSVVARPIVLGGDDLTMIVRADLAFKFAKEFLGAFEEESQKTLQKHLGAFKISGLPDMLTACAGVALIKSSYPFAKAYELAESLCSYAKKIAKENLHNHYVPSCFSFHRVTASISDDYDAIMKKELTSSEGLKLWFGPYSVGRHMSKLTPYAEIEKLSDILEAFPRGTARTLISTLYKTTVLAESDYNRILHVAGTDKSKELSSQIKKMTGQPDNKPWTSDLRTPLFDAYILNIVRGKQSGNGGQSDAESPA